MSMFQGGPLKIVVFLFVLPPKTHPKKGKDGKATSLNLFFCLNQKTTRRCEGPRLVEKLPAEVGGVSRRPQHHPAAEDPVLAALAALENGGRDSRSDSRKATLGLGGLWGLWGWVAGDKTRPMKLTS